MDFVDVVRARRMVRSYRTEPVPAPMLDEMLDLARRAPSAGRSQGTDFVVLEGPDQTTRFWDTTLPVDKRPDFPWPGLLRAPVLVLPVADSRRYVERYGETDKEKTGLGESDAAWAIPYWHIDTAMAAMTLLHAAVDRGLGALFFGIFDNTSAVCERFGIPDGAEPIGAIALGWADDQDRVSKSVATRQRRPLDTVIHRGHWLPSGE